MKKAPKTLSSNGFSHTSTLKSRSIASEGDAATVLSTDSSISGTIHSGTMFLNKPSSEVTKTGNLKLGTFSGVYIPCLQSIIGVILFIRLPFITAQAGVLLCTAIIALCTMASLLTTYSLSVIATNGTIREGGPYYVLSRSLGQGVGTAIGFLFYLGNTLSTSMYVMGAVETWQSTAISYLVSFYPSIDSQIMSLVLVFMITTIVSVGGDYIAMTSSVFLMIVVVSIISILIGSTLFAFGVYDGTLTAGDRVYMDNIHPSYVVDRVTEIQYDFTALVALFFPSVTGILSGSTNSANLANPADSIPKGTFGAIATTTTLYLVVVWLVGCIVSNLTLRNDKLVLAALAWPTLHLIKFGIITSCVGAALQCLASATRLFSAMANDDALLILNFFKSPPNSSTYSLRTLWFTGLFAALPTLLGNIDHLSPFVTMFYILMYSGINLSCFLLSFLKTPGFRPTFKSHWSISLIGFIWCIVLAFFISLPTAMITIILFLALLMYNRKNITKKQDVGDVWKSLQFTMLNNLLRSLAGTTTKEIHAKNWRPQVLTVLDGPSFEEKLHLLSFAAQLDKGRGINVVCAIVPTKNSILNPESLHMRISMKKWLEDSMKNERMEGYAEVFPTNQTSFCDVILSSVIHTGLGPVSPNTVLLSWFDSWREASPEAVKDYIHTLTGVQRLNKALIIFKGDETYPRLTKVANAFIDIWWIVHDGGLLLLLPYLLSRNKVWSHHTTIRLFACVTSMTENPEKLYGAVMDHLAAIRISATVTIINLSETNIADHMRQVEYRTEQENDDISAKTNTQNKTVGEVFSQVVYDVPYQQFGQMGIETDINQPIYTFSNNADFVILQINGAEDDSTLNSMKKSDNDDASKFHTALSFNNLLMEYSSDSNLVVSNMPLLNLGDLEADDDNTEFMEYVDVMSAGISNLLLIRGTGSEVITTYA